MDEPVELSDGELDEVAGGFDWGSVENIFNYTQSITQVGSSPTSTNSASNTVSVTQG